MVMRMRQQKTGVVTERVSSQQTPKFVSETRTSKLAKIALMGQKKE